MIEKLPPELAEMVVEHTSIQDNIAPVSRAFCDVVQKSGPRRQSIDKCKAYVRSIRLRHTGLKDCNKSAHPFPLFQGFVCNHVAFCRRCWGYKPHRSGRKPGNKNRFYTWFRDSVLLVALKELRAESAGLTIAEVPPVTFHRWPAGRIRSLVGWEVCLNS